MPPPYTGQELAKALIEMKYQPVDRTGSHLKLRYTNPHTDEVRSVSIPMGGEIPAGTLRKIAEQCGANDFRAWCEWIDELR